jgi:hypothetical protein
MRYIDEVFDPSSGQAGFVMTAPQCGEAEVDIHQMAAALNPLGPPSYSRSFSDGIATYLSTHFNI